MEQPKKLRISSAGTHSKILVAAAFILFLLRNASPQDAVPLDAGHFDYSATAALEVKEISVQQRDCVRYRIRHHQRQRREAVPVPVVALVGYTNAGKSTLSNALTEAGVLESARMFATLDPNSGSCGFLHAARYCSPIPSASEEQPGLGFVVDENLIPLDFRDVEAKIPGRVWQNLPQEAARSLSGCVQQVKPSNEAIKQAAATQESVPGAEVRRRFHLRAA
jgi:hypothetical protein